MADMGTEITTPVGRIVWGHPVIPQFKTDQQTRQPVLNDQGQKIQQWSFGLAIPRADFEAVVWPAMFREAAKGYPNGTPTHFSWKYKDGDRDIDRQAKPYNQREGYAGHIVLTCTTELAAPNVFKLEGNGYRQMQPEEIKCGDYVRAGLNFKVNVPKNVQHTPGLYVNPLAVEFVGYGTEIKNSYQADPTALFGGQAVPLPPGASAVPVAPPAAVQMPGMGAQPAPPPVQPQMMPQPQAAAPPLAPPPPTPVAGPQRPIDPAHIHDNGDGTEQWVVNGAWDGGRHPKPVAAAPLPPPAHGFVDQAGGAMPQAMPSSAPGSMPFAPPPR